MKIVWDERKRQTTLEMRAMDFADLTVDFFERSVVVAAKRGRYKAIGAFGGLTIAVIFKHLGTEAVSIVSMRQASEKEKALL